MFATSCKPILQKIWKIFQNFPDLYTIFSEKFLSSQLDKIKLKMLSSQLDITRVSKNTLPYKNSLVN